ncbi:MAG: CDP-alcohol phosphatidyltransferase family protein [Aeromonas sp.]
MLDRYLIPLIRRPLAALATPLARAGVRADHVTLLSFALGLLALPLLALEYYAAALVAIGLNRLGDGLDGALARLTARSDRGGFLDISLDFIFYAAVPLGFALSDPTRALPAACLLFSFMATAASFLAFAVLAAKRGLANPVYQHKAFYYLGGLTEGFETIALFIAMCLWPQAFAPLAYAFASLCLITAANRLYFGYATLK